MSQFRERGGYRSRGTDRMRTFRDAPPLIDRDENDVVKETHTNKDTSGSQKRPRGNFKKGNP